jgi:hypothetical protein
VLRTMTAIALEISTPVGPAPTKTKVSSSLWPTWVFFCFRHLECLQYVVPYRDGISQALQAWGVLLKFFMSKIAALHACGENQVVI